jgi:hypothetical protein
MLALQGEEGMDVSIETLVEDPVIVDGIEVYHGWTVLGTTILGKGVTPAVAGAHIRTCSFEDELNGLKLKVASYQEEQERNEDNHFTERKIRRMNRKQLEALQARFPEHIVVNASDDGLNVCLLTRDGYPCIYAFGSADEQTIATERIEPIAVNAVYQFASGREVTVDLNQIFDFMNMGSESMKGQIAALSADKEELQKEIDSCKAELNAMKEAERKRRVQAVKDAAKAALDRFNACQPADEAVDDEMCKQIAEEADKGEYDGCCRNNGEWCGDKMAEEKVLAYCATKVAEINKMKAQQQRNQSKSTFAWDMAKGGDGIGTGLDGLLSRVNNK